MKKSFRKRIRSIKKHLQFFLTDNEYFRVGLLFDDYLKSELLDKYNLPKQFPTKSEFIPLPKGSVTKVNIKGKYVRKQPEEKEEIIKQIRYIRKKDKVKVEYKRKYNIYKKVLLHQYNTSLYFLINEHNQKVVVSEELQYTNQRENELKSTHITNIFCEIFNDFEVFDKDLNPAIHFNTKFNDIILPSGELSNPNTFDDLIEIGNRFNKNDDDKKAYQKRLQILKEYNPDIRGKGPNGFHGYIVFGFTKHQIVLLETMYAGNATYVFSMEDFENKVIVDKQTVLKQKLHLKKFIHHKNWEENIRKFMKKLENDNNSSEKK